MKECLWCAVFTLALAVPPVHADVWDTATDTDDSSGTDNELVHGTIQVHDMGVRPGPVADQDWYLVYVPPYSSFEIVLDGITGDLNLYVGGAFDRIASDGTTVVQSGEGVSSGVWSMRMAWQNTTASTLFNYIRVANPSCTTSCSSSDQYRIVARETTVSVPRFNNGGSQITVLLSQNASSSTESATYFYWSTAGVLLQTGNLNNFPARNLNVFNTTGFAALVGQSGHITIAHTAPYGQWNVKTIALEPSTGFSFDTPGVVRGY